jgi:hypothetical protein
MHWLFERMIVFIMVIAMIAGFFLVTAPRAVNELHDAPPNLRLQFVSLISATAVVSNGLVAFGFFYLKRSSRDWRRFGLSRVTWLFLVGFSYLLGAALGLACFLQP